MTYRDWPNPGKWLTENGQIPKDDLPRLAKSWLTTRQNLKPRYQLIRQYKAPRHIWWFRHKTNATGAIAISDVKNCLYNEDQPFLMIAWSAGASTKTGNGNRLFSAPASWLNTNRRPKRRPSSGILLLTSGCCLCLVSFQDGGNLNIAQWFWTLINGTDKTVHVYTTHLHRPGRWISQCLLYMYLSTRYGLAKRKKRELSP